MTDLYLRELEGKYKRSGAKSDERAFDAERVRLGVAGETGFLQRREEECRSYRARVRMYSADGSMNDFSVWKLFPRQRRGESHLVQGVEFADEQLHFLTYGGLTPAHGFNIYLTSVSVDGAVETRTLNPAPGGVRMVRSMVSVDGMLGLVEERRNGSAVLVGDRLVFRSTVHVFDYSKGAGFLYFESQAEGIPVWSSGDKLQALFPESQHAADERGLYLRGGLISSGSLMGSNCRMRTKGGQNNFAGFPIPKESRLMQKRFVAPLHEELERYHSQSGGTMTKIIFEVPKKNLEGLLIAVERASHKKVKK